MKLRDYVLNPWKIVLGLSNHGLYAIIPDSLFLRCQYRNKLGKSLNLKNPITYNEKLQWLKLYDRKDIYTILVDKYEVKQHVRKIIGDEYIIPTLGVWNSVEEIDFDSLPEQFVLKCTHDSGGLVICKDKNLLNISQAKLVLKASLNNNYYWSGREWPYKGVKPRIIAEQYMEDSETQELRDYKFFAFDGECKVMFVASGRQKKDEDVKFDFYDLDFNHLDIKHGHEWATGSIEKPKNFDKMISFAELLSKGIPEIRVDFYEVDGHLYFGELTLFHHCGFVPFIPEKWDYVFGSWVKLPKN